MKLTIRAPEGALGKSYLAAPVDILLDDKPLDGVVSVEFEMSVDDIARAKVVLMIDELELDGVPVETIENWRCSACGERTPVGKSDSGT